MVGEGAGATGGEAHLEGGLVGVGLDEASQEARHGGVAGAHGVHHGALGGRALEDRAVVAHEDAALARHGDEHVLGTPLLELIGVRNDFVARLELDAKDLAQLEVVGLDEERAQRQHLCEQVALGVDHDADASAGQALHDSLVHVAGQRVGHRARDDERVTLAEGIELGVELLDVGLGDLGTLTVELGLLVGLDLGVDAAHALVHLDEVRVNAALGDEAGNLGAGEAGKEAQRAALVAQVAENDGHVDALAARQRLLVGGAVDDAEAHVVNAHDVVD